MKYTSKGPFEQGYNKMISAVENPEMMGMEFGRCQDGGGRRDALWTMARRSFTTCSPAG